MVLSGINPLGLTFRKHYFILASILFVIEVVIAVFVRDRFVRPYLGDVLVVMLIYCSIQSIFRARVLPLAIAVLVLSFIIECLQYINIVDKLGLRDSEIASTVIGTSFQWGDIAAYVIGTIVIVVVERVRMRLTDFGNS
jgi:hypothetical protein